VSASLGAVELQRTAGALEKACASFGDSEPIERCLQAVVVELDPVIRGLAEI
jgi:hypothetical protein